MNKFKKVCVITGSRSEYGLLYWLLKNIEASTILDLQIIVTGMHLSPEFGLTYKQIEKDGFTISKKIETLLSSDSEESIVKSIGLGMIGFSDAFRELCPDLIIILGDRFEIYPSVISAMIQKIPVAHIHGGETTLGAFDEYVRHSITKCHIFILPQLKNIKNE